MHQQIPPPIDQYGVQPQMAPVVICPVQFVYDAQIVLPQSAVSEEVHQQPMLLNVQNPPPWHQNRHQNVIYVQQMPNQILPYVPQNIVQNQIYTPQFSYRMPQQVVSQDMIIHEIPQTQTTTENNEPAHVQKMPLLTQLLHQKPIEIQQEKPVMLSQQVQTDFPLKINKNSSISIQQNIAIKNSLKQNDVPKEVSHVDSTKIKPDPPNIQMDERNKIDHEQPSNVKNVIPGAISIKSYKPILRPIVTPSGVKSSINNIPIKLRALDPTQVISIPNYGTITNYTVLNEDKDVKIPTEMQNIHNINTDKIITAKLNEKNEITFIQNTQKSFLDPVQTIMPNNINKKKSIGTNTETNETRAVTKEIPILLSNETQTAGKFIANRIAKVFSNERLIMENDTRKSVKNETTEASKKNDARKIALKTFTTGTKKTITTGTPKTIKIESLKTVKIDVPKTMANDINKVTNYASSPVSIQPEKVKSTEIKQIIQKVDKNTETEFDQPLIKTVAPLNKTEAKTKTIEAIKKKIATKNAANERFRKNDVYILTHVLDGHVIQESNVAFPIYVPAKENYSYEPFHEVARRKRTEEPSLPLKNLQIDDNAKSMDEPIEITLVPNHPIDPNEELNDMRLVRNRPVTMNPSEAPIDPQEVTKMTNDKHEVFTVTNDTHEVTSAVNTHEISISNKETVPNGNKLAGKTDKLQTNMLKNNSKEPVVSIERYIGSKERNKRSVISAYSIELSEVSSSEDVMSKHKPQKAAIPPKAGTNREAKVPMVSIERLVVAKMSITRNEVAAGPVNIDTNEINANVTFDSVKNTNRSENNRSKENLINSEGNKAKKEDNPFSMLQKCTVERWNMDTLFSHLTKNNWNATAETLKEQEIDGEALLLANKDQLIAIGVNEKHADVISDFINIIVIESD